MRIKMDNWIPANFSDHRRSMVTAVAPVADSEVQMTGVDQWGRVGAVVVQADQVQNAVAIKARASVQAPVHAVLKVVHKARTVLMVTAARMTSLVISSVSS
jgi:hypothetical protein